jgi:hypothetical protein
VPGRVPAAEPWQELQDPEEGVRRRADDVHHEWEREASEPVVGGDDGRSAGELGQSQCAGRHGDRAEHERGYRQGPAALPGAHRVTGCAADVVAGASAVWACLRWPRHSETPRPISATPVGTANGRLKDSGSTDSARAEVVL